MNPETRQEALRRHGLTESADGYDLTPQGFQRASRRALTLREQGDREAARMLALDPSNPLRWEYARCIQIDAYTAEVHHSGI
ncbi:hypothetical protein [Streptomyces aurantiogriseus]|uniref:Uncharacterized protein n=1 Tax=Streptomyces aurantiogriseus TaxID=66870 RepID=A0A918FD32_9ACTN|nr:hypothetical protein [Streptomyces aurantiogriseus]GGR23981.1 hypothetical protein GCM10010251_45070 [Streptomyces aurantiogriseus]